MSHGRTCDVLVAGGGPSGVAAALGAASMGCRTILVERYGFFGGLAACAGIATLCGLYCRDPNGARFVSNGFARMFAERMARPSDAKVYHAGQGLHVLPYDIGRIKRLADTLICDQPLIEPMLHATVADVAREDRRVVEARVVSDARHVVIHPRAVVDATGDAIVVRLAEGAADDVSASQAPSAIVVLDRPLPRLVDPGVRLAILRDVARAVEEGLLAPECATASFVVSDFAHERVRIKLCLHQRETTALEMSARAIVDQLMDFLAKKDAFAHAHLAHDAITVGLRATWKVRGRYTLSRSDVLAARKWDDGVARGAWPIELWRPESRMRLELLPEGDHYDIPVPCLQADTFDNVFVAGRCLSAEPEALASARVIGTALDTGFAAGTLAAHAALDAPVKNAVQRLREALEGRVSVAEMIR